MSRRINKLYSSAWSGKQKIAELLNVYIVKGNFKLPVCWRPLTLLEDDVRKSVVVDHALQGSGNLVEVEVLVACPEIAGDRVLLVTRTRFLVRTGSEKVARHLRVRTKLGPIVIHSKGFDCLSWGHLGQGVKKVSGLRHNLKKSSLSEHARSQFTHLFLI